MVASIVTRTILLIDDDPIVLKSFKKLLIHEGYQVIPATSYDEAIAAIRDKDFDLVLSDIRMPRKDGVETVAEIQNSLKASGKKDLPIIFITGYAEYGRQRHADFLGETLYKPIDSQRLLQTIREYL